MIRLGLREVIIKVYLMPGIKMVMMVVVLKIHMWKWGPVEFDNEGQVDGIIGMSVGYRPLKTQDIQ